MNKKYRNFIINQIEMEIKESIMLIRTGGPDNETLAKLKSLMELRSSLEKPKYDVKPEVVISAIANLLGILLIINHERINVITSKAFNLIIKSRV